MELEDTGRTGLPKDERRWPVVQSHLMAQAVAGLKLLTIARGFDEDFRRPAPAAAAAVPRRPDVFFELHGPGGGR